MEQLYNERLSCYLTAMRNEKPDRIPIRPFVTDFTREHGVYSSGSSQPVATHPDITPAQDAVFGSDYGMPEYPNAKVKAGVCIPWEEKVKELPTIVGDRDLAQRVWEDIDALGSSFIWQCLLSF